jgi:hypothetical protein
MTPGSERERRYNGLPGGWDNLDILLRRTSRFWIEQDGQYVPDTFKKIGLNLFNISENL